MPLLRSLLLSLLVASGITTGAIPSRAEEDKPLVVFAAASLKNALDAAAAAYQAETGKKVTVSYAGSSALAKQIEQAAPADVFISADLEWLDYLANKNLIKADTRTNLFGNSLALIAPAATETALKIAPGFKLADAIGSGRMAVADVSAVPAGKYAKAALGKLGVWADVEPKLAQAENVRAALALVARGEAAYGIVYQTDAKAEPKVKVVDTFPAGTHPAIVYPAAAIAASAAPDAAAAFLTYLESAKGEQPFVDAGFTVID